MLKFCIVNICYKWPSQKYFQDINISVSPGVEQGPLKKDMCHCLQVHHVFTIHIKIWEHLSTLYALGKPTVRIIATCPKDKHSQDFKSLPYVTQSRVWPKEIKMLLLHYLFSKISNMLLSAFTGVSHGHRNLELKGILTLPNPYTSYPSQSQCFEYDWIFFIFQWYNLIPLLVILLFLVAVLLKKGLILYLIESLFLLLFLLVIFNSAVKVHHV